jgi:AcrR family transcriptional regulator
MAEVNRRAATAGRQRPYRSALREAQAAQTRRTILDAAGEVFAGRGYAFSTVDAIAARAGVAPETVYRAFGSKRALLARWVDTRVVGDDAPIPLIERSEVDALRAERDPVTRVDMAAALAGRIHGRSAGAIGVLRTAAAADPDIAALWSDLRARGRADTSTLLRLIAGDTGLSPDVDAEEADDFFDALVGPETYLLLVDEHGWPPERYERWIAHVLRQALLAPP